VTTPISVGEALALQAHGCGQLGSELYRRLLEELGADLAEGGLTAELLEGRSSRPAHDALPLRLLGAVHRIVLRGDGPQLAAVYPSAGGSDDGEPLLERFFDVVRCHRAEIERALDEQVQTNEVGRCAALVVGFSELARRFAHPLALLEVGSSCGLNLQWDRYWYDTGDTHAGDDESPVRFEHSWGVPAPALRDDITVSSRSGCDIAPLDATSPDDRLRLLSFVWPDQRERFTRLRAALDIAASSPPDLSRADAGAWIEGRLATTDVDTTTVVFHSIVWQYLPRETKTRLRAALADAGARATTSAPVAWLRLEPAGPVAELTLTTWPGGDETVLVQSGYHGPPVRALPSGD
jgi:hypothetical protein